MKIVLAVKNQGHVPSFKTQKRAGIHRVTGKPFVVSKKEIREWMEKCTQSFESQLFSASLTTGGETLTAPPPLSSIVSSLPLDDSRQWISELLVVDADVAKGEEGAEITITEIV